MQEETCAKCGKVITASDKVVRDEGKTFCSNLCCVTHDRDTHLDQLWLNIAEVSAL